MLNFPPPTLAGHALIVHSLCSWADGLIRHNPGSVLPTPLQDAKPSQAPPQPPADFLALPSSFPGTQGRRDTDPSVPLKSASPAVVSQHQGRRADLAGAALQPLHEENTIVSRDMDQEDHNVSSEESLCSATSAAEGMLMGQRQKLFVRKQTTSCDSCATAYILQDHRVPI